jgi:hypothetical protein
MNDYGALRWDPGDLRIPVSEFRTRYDADLWAQFEAAMRREKIAELPGQPSVWEWLGGDSPPPRKMILTDAEAAPLLERTESSLKVAAEANGLREIRVVPSEELAARAGGVPSEEIGGLYEQGVIYLRQDLPEPQTRAIYYHEMAHVFDPALPSGRYKVSHSGEWLGLTGWEESAPGRWTLRPTSDLPPSAYALRDPAEDFGETFRVVVAGSPGERARLREFSPARYSFVKQLLEANNVTIPE